MALNDKQFAMMAGRVVQALPPDLGKAVMAALENNPYIHGGPNAGIGRSGKQQRARAFIEQRANSGDQRAAAARSVAKTLIQAQRGNDGPARALTLRVIKAAPLGRPAMAGDLDIRGGGPRYARLEPMSQLSGSSAKAKLKKAVTAPLKLANTITHSKKSPIRKAELALQKTVGKALPFTKPFISAHNKLAGQVQKGIGKVTGSKVNPKAVSAAAKLAAAGKAGKNAEAIAKQALSASKNVAAAALKKGAKPTAAMKNLAKSLAAVSKAGADLAKVKQLSTGSYKVMVPGGKTITIPASKVMG